MKILLDENIPKKLKFRFGSEVKVFTSQDMGWKGKKNGELLLLIAEDEFDIFITMDKNLRHQQNLDDISFIILILDAPNNKISTLSNYASRVVQILNTKIKPGILEIKL